jgi:hypothetical protein
MIRKFAIAIAAIAALGTASLTVTATPAAAGGIHHHHGGHWGGHYRHFGFYGAPMYAYADTCVRRVWVDTPVGPRRRLVNVCD